MKVGYRRVSTIDQNPDRQLHGIDLEKMWTDFATGGNTDRPQLTLMLDFVREGDAVHVASIDRLARSLDDLLMLVRKLNEKKVSVVFEKENLTFCGEDNAMSRLLLQIFGAILEFEKTLINERVRQGVALAKAAGKYKGRKHSLDAAQVVILKERLAAGEPKTRIAKDFGCRRETLYRYLDKPAAVINS